jgi:hypothetical protein
MNYPELLARSFAVIAQQWCLLNSSMQAADDWNVSYRGESNLSLWLHSSAAPRAAGAVLTGPGQGRCS